MYKIQDYILQSKLSLDLILNQEKNIEKLSQLILSALSKKKKYLFVAMADHQLKLHILQAS